MFSVLNKCSQALETLSEPHLPNILFGDPNDYDFKPIDSLPILTSPMYTPTVKYSFTSGDNKNTVVQNITSLLDINPFILKNKELMTKDSATETDPLFCEKCSIIKTKPTSDASTLTDFRSEMKSVYSQVNTDELATIKLFKSNNSESNSSKGKSLMHMTPAEILTASEKPHGDYSNPYNINQTLHSSRSTLNDFTSSNNFNFNRPTPNEINHRAQDNFRHDSSIEQNLMKNQRNLSNASISSKPMMKNINTKSLPLSFLLSSLCKSSNKPSDSK